MLTRFRNLNLRFVGEEGGEGGGEAPVIEQQLASTEQHAPAQQSQGNPAWAPFREALDPISFSKIEAHLKAMDQQAQARITSVNQQFEPYKPILEGRQPDYVQKALTYAEQLDADPEAVYQMLGEYLRQNGRLPNADEAQDALDEQEGEGPAQDPRFDILQQQLQSFQQQQLEAQASTKLEREIASLQDTHKELAPEDVTEIIRRAAFVAQQNAGRPGAKIPSLEESYQEYAALRNRILSTPRAGDSAPQLIPTSGGTPSGQQQKSLGQLGRGEVQDAVVALLQAGKGN